MKPLEVIQGASPADSWPSRKPRWLKVRAPGGPNYQRLKELMRGLELSSVCEEAQCPNIGECWEAGTATFLIMGDVCTRNCPYCAIAHGRPEELDEDEPRRVAEAIERLQLNHCVITSVDRDDLPDGGAFIFAQCVLKIRERMSDAPDGIKVETLIPDFQGNGLKTMVRARPDVLNHNIETVRRVFHGVRPKGDYDYSLELLEQVKCMAPEMPTKSGMMVGLGESREEILETMDDLRAVNCDLLTIGQYLRPSQKHAPVSKFYTPGEFFDLQREGLRRGFRHVAAGPLVRSSYHADEQHTAASLVLA